jgi:hypothetical protein
MFFIPFTWLMYSLFSTLALAPFGGSSIPGANEYARIQSFISTTQKHKFDIFTQLVAVFQGQKTLIGT